MFASNGAVTSFGEIAELLLVLQRLREKSRPPRPLDNAGRVQSPIEILHRPRIRPRDNEKIGIAPRRRRRFDFSDHLFNIDDRFAGEMSATLGKFLVLDVTTRQTRAFQFADRSRHIFRASKTGVRINNRGDFYRVRNVPARCATSFSVSRPMSGTPAVALAIPAPLI